MKFVSAAIVALAMLATLGGYLQEKKRLETIRGLPPAAARDLYERAQVRRDRLLMELVLGICQWIYVLELGRPLMFGKSVAASV